VQRNRWKHQRLPDNVCFGCPYRHFQLASYSAIHLDRDLHLVFAREDALLTADERAVVGADKPTKADDPGGTKMDLVVDGPFLVAFLAPKAERPYLLLWVGSAEGLSR